MTPPNNVTRSNLVQNSEKLLSPQEIWIFEKLATIMSPLRQGANIVTPRSFWLKPPSAAGKIGIFGALCIISNENSEQKP